MAMAQESFFLAASTGDLSQVEAFIAEGGDISAVNGTGVTGLVIAAQHGHVEVVKALVDAGFPVSSSHAEGALAAACRIGSLDFVQYMLDTGFKQTESELEYEDPVLVIAVRSGQVALVRFLLEKGFDVNATKRSAYKEKGYGQPVAGPSALIVACEEGKEEMVELLLEHNAAVDMQDKNGDTALRRAKQKGHEKIAERLLRAGANPDVKRKAKKKVAVKLNLDLSKGPSAYVQGKLTRD